MVMFEGYFNLRQCFRKRLHRSLVRGDCIGPVTNNHPLVTKSRRLDINFLGLCERDASGGVPRLVEIKKAYSLGIPKKKLAICESHTEEEHACGEEYTMFGFNGRSIRSGSVERGIAGKNSGGDLDPGGSGAGRGFGRSALRAQGRAARVSQREAGAVGEHGIGSDMVELPRARLTEGEEEKEWQSMLIERYQRRARSVDSALLGCYLSGTNGRRIRGALSPLLRGAPLSKSAISRIVGRLQALFTDWRQRSLKEEAVVWIYLDAIALRVRIAAKVVSAPVLVALAVKADGQKVVLHLELLGSESGECWGGFVEGLVHRGLKRPRLVLIDGNKGLRAAVEKNWPGIKVQRCTVHKLRNLERHTPRHA